MALHDERVLVMGGSSGIGEATAALFAAEGATVVVTGRDKERLDAAAERIGHPVAVRALDGTDPAALAAFFAEDTRYDHLVLTLSGGAGAGPFESLDLAALRTGFEAKFWAQVATMQAALPRLTEHASITVVSAASARAALPGTAGLAAINGALEAMIRPLAVELGPRRVNAVSPGIIDTPWWHAMPAADRERLFAEHAGSLPVGRIGAAEDVARAILLVATNGFMTGSVVEVAGGVHLATGR